MSATEVLGQTVYACNTCGDQRVEIFRDELPVYWREYLNAAGERQHECGACRRARDAREVRR